MFTVFRDPRSTTFLGGSRNDEAAGPAERHSRSSEVTLGQAAGVLQFGRLTLNFGLQTFEFSSNAAVCSAMDCRTIRLLWKGSACVNSVCHTGRPVPCRSTSNRFFRIYRLVVNHSRAEANPPVNRSKERPFVNEKQIESDGIHITSFWPNFGPTKLCRIWQLSKH